MCAFRPSIAILVLPFTVRLEFFATFARILELGKPVLGIEHDHLAALFFDFANQAVAHLVMKLYAFREFAFDIIEGLRDRPAHHVFAEAVLVHFDNQAGFVA